MKLHHTVGTDFCLLRFRYNLTHCIARGFGVVYTKVIPPYCKNDGLYDSVNE